MNENIKLSISILVSNSIDTIEKCMNSLQPILQNVSSELIVVDTGGTDGSIEIARKYATKVIPFVWCNDFAKARNVGLSASKGEWFLFLDDDEWFEDVEPIIQFFNSGEYLRYNSSSYNIRNYRNKQGTIWEDVNTYRMVKKVKETRFVSPIHEVLTPVVEPVKQLDCYVHHYGYAFESREEAIKHSYRNLPLIEKALEKNPEDYRLILQLIQEYKVINEPKKAEKISWDAVKKIEKSKLFTPDNMLAMGWILINIVDSKINENQSQALEYARKILKLNWINEITKNGMYYYMINIYYESKDYKRCLEYIPPYEVTFNNLINDDVYRRKQITLQLGNMLKENVLSKIYTKGICAASMLDDKVLLNKYLDLMIKLGSYVKTEHELEVIIKYLLEEKDKNKKNKILSHLLQNEETVNNLLKIMESDLFDDFSKKQICVMISNSEVSYKKLFPYQIYANHAKEKREEIRNQLEIYIGQENNVLNITYLLLDLIKEYNINISKNIDNQGIKKWIESLNRFVFESSNRKIESWIDILEKNSQKGFNSNMLYMRCIEKKIRFENLEEMEYEDLHQMLVKYSSVVKTVYTNVYQEEAFGNEFSIFLPKTCRFIHKVENIIQNKATKIEIARIMKEAAEIYPEMAEFCKHYVLKLKQIDKVNKEKDEFTKLGNIIKEKIKIFITQEEYEVAKQTLNQLKIMIPYDSEVFELEKQLQS